MKRTLLNDIKKGQGALLRHIMRQKGQEHLTTTGKINKKRGAEDTTTAHKDARGPYDKARNCK